MIQRQQRTETQNIFVCFRGLAKPIINLLNGFSVTRMLISLTRAQKKTPHKL